MLDALLPAAAALEDGARQGQKMQPTMSAAVAAAQAGVEATVTMRPRLGRSSYLGDQAIGHPDPGAFPVPLWLWAIGTALCRPRLEERRVGNGVLRTGRTPGATYH